jgi:hypothetical protein
MINIKRLLVLAVGVSAVLLGRKFAPGLRREIRLKRM